MGWLLGALGIGGIGVALFLVPGLAANALKALSALLDLIRRNPALFAIIALSVALAAVWYIKGGQVDAANKRTGVQVALVAKWKAANDAATAWAKAEAARKDQLAETAKDNANAALKPSLAAGQAATDRYVAANRCVRVAAPESRGVRADMSGAVPVAGQPQGDGGPHDVAVTERDLAVCTANTLRLDNAVNVWAADMVARGLAK